MFLVEIFVLEGHIFNYLEVNSFMGNEVVCNFSQYECLYVVRMDFEV